MTKTCKLKLRHTNCDALELNRKTFIFQKQNNYTKVQVKTNSIRSIVLLFVSSIGICKVQNVNFIQKK